LQSDYVSVSYAKFQNGSSVIARIRPYSYDLPVANDCSVFVRSNNWLKKPNLNFA